MMRKILEFVTGIVTGSDASIKQTQSLQLLGFVGEGTVSESNSIFITSTRFPDNSGTKFVADRMFAITRNPLDVIPSLLYYLNTRS